MPTEFFLDNGRVIEDGRVDELLSAGGRFDEFWRQQQDAAEWRIHAGQSSRVCQIPTRHLPARPASGLM